MKALHDHGFPVPTPVDSSRHAVLMTLVSGFPLTSVKVMTHPDAVYNELMNLLLRLGACGLIHCDFNEFNLLIDAKERITLIDFPQMVSTSHFNAASYFDRDVLGVRDFFRHRLGFTPDSYPRFEDIGARTIDLDSELRASGFGETEAAEFDELCKAQHDALTAEGAAAVGAAGARERAEDGEEEEDGDDDDEEEELEGEESEGEGEEEKAVVASVDDGTAGEAGVLSLADVAGACADAAADDAEAAAAADAAEEAAALALAEARAARAAEAAARHAAKGAGAAGGSDGGGGAAASDEDAGSGELPAELLAAVEEAKLSGKGCFTCGDAGHKSRKCPGVAVALARRAARALVKEQAAALAGGAAGEAGGAALDAGGAALFADDDAFKNIDVDAVMAKTKRQMQQKARAKALASATKSGTRNRTKNRDSAKLKREIEDERD